MQILASALPGLREIRAPILAGYIWLFFGWLIIQPDLSQPPHVGGQAATVYDLGHDVGRLAIFAAVSVAAYLIGSASQTLSNQMRKAWETQLHNLTLAYPLLRTWTKGVIELEERGALSALVRRGDGMIERGERTERINREVASELRETLEHRAKATAHEEEEELDLPAVLLVGKESELFAEVGRLRSEGELRLAVVPPLLGMATLLTTTASFWWLATIPAIAILFSQGVQQELASKKIIRDARNQGRIKSGSRDQFSQWLDTTLRPLANDESPILDSVGGPRDEKISSGRSVST